MPTRKTWIWVLALTGAAAIGWGFRLQAVANAENAAWAFAGRSAEGTAAPWVFGILGGVLILMALGMVVSGAQGASTRAIPMGWHDDPEDPGKLRYHDGSGWTEKTARKGSESAG